MDVMTLLVKVQYFPEIVKQDSSLLEAYVIDYADYSTFILEQLGFCRYRQFVECVLGDKNPNRFTNLMLEHGNKVDYYCNTSSTDIHQVESQRAFLYPDKYALVLCNCFC